MIWIKMVRWSLWDPSISGTTVGATIECAGAVADFAGAVSAEQLLLELFVTSAAAVVGIFG